MMAKRITKLAAVACMAVLVLALSGCFGQPSQANDPNRQYRTYMSQVNQIMVEFEEGLASFNEAVSRNDVVNMGNQLDQALKSLDKLETLEAPSSMANVHKDYVDAAGKLETALRDYVDVYTEIDAAVKAEKADWSDYKDRIATIQERYDEGVKALEEADAAAAKAGTF